VDLFNADGLAGEDLAEIDFLVAQADAATTVLAIFPRNGVAG